jgi:peptidoglycan/xylan/chitin deacetylase (PgdA/CDA1 family)
MSKRKVITGIFAVIFAVLLSFVAFLRTQYVAPILMYHSVTVNTQPGNRLQVSTDSFERQMRFLKSHRYNVVPLEELAQLIKKNKRIPSRTTAITFDDGYKDNYTHAFPVLKKYHLPATIFVIINEVGRPLGDRLGWDEIKIMQDSGIISFGSHALGPEPLINITQDEELKQQIFDSKRILEEKLASKIKAFSYPGGMFNTKIRQLVKEAGYELAVATNPGKKFANDDTFALKRLRISSTSDNLFVFWVETSGYYNFMREHRHK